MTPRFCPRCEQALPAEADGSLVFCPACGAPQVTISEQLIDEAQQRRAGGNAGSAESATGSEPPPASLDATRDALRTAALAGAVAGGLALLSIALPPVGLLLWLWIVGAPVVALGLYSAKRRQPAPGAGFGARLGFLCGLAVTVALAVVNTVSLLVARFALHKAGPIDAQFAAVFAQVRGATEAQYGAATAAPFTAMLGVPEFRAGLVLFSFAMFTAAYLILATLGGAFAGVLRGRAAQT